MKGKEGWDVKLKDGATFHADKLLIATGGNLSMWDKLKNLGYNIGKPVPSLFTLNCKDNRIEGLAGVSVQKVKLKVPGSNITSEGALLITHWGFSGPAILKLSAFGAVDFADREYKFSLRINWANGLNEEKVKQLLKKEKEDNPRNSAAGRSMFGIPGRLWESILNYVGINDSKRWNEVSDKIINILAVEITNSEYSIDGKSVFKEEFVTCGGVELKQVNFKTMESRLHSNLFFAGEVLNIDGLTGGFNFQSAWTTAYIAAKAMGK